MTEEQENQKSEEDITLGQVEIAGLTMGFYFRVIIFPVILALAFSITYVLLNQFFDFVWIVYILAFLYITYAMASKNRGVYKQAVIANALAGLIMGFVFALFKLVWLGNFYLFFNLFVEPVLAALIGIAIAVVLVYIYSSLIPQRKNNSIINNLKSSLKAQIKKGMTGGSPMPEKKSNDKDAEENKSIAVLSYIFFLFVIPLFLKKESKFCQFHGKQGLVLFIVAVLGSLVYWIPFIGWALGILIVALAVLGIYQAWQGNYWEMPVIGQFAKKLNI